MQSPQIITRIEVGHFCQGTSRPLIFTVEGLRRLIGHHRQQLARSAAMLGAPRDNFRQVLFNMLEILIPWWPARLPAESSHVLSIHHELICHFLKVFIGLLVELFELLPLLTIYCSTFSSRVS